MYIFLITFWYSITLSLNFLYQDYCLLNICVAMALTLFVLSHFGACVQTDFVNISEESKNSFQKKFLHLLNTLNNTMNNKYWFFVRIHICSSIGSLRMEKFAVNLHWVGIIYLIFNIDHTIFNISNAVSLPQGEFDTLNAHIPIWSRLIYFCYLFWTMLGMNFCYPKFAQSSLY